MSEKTKKITNEKTFFNRVFSGESGFADFLNSHGFIYIIAAITLLFWSLQLDFPGVIVLMVISGLCFFFCKDATPAMTAVIFMFFVFSDVGLKLEGNEPYLALIALPVAGAIYNIIRFKSGGFKLQGFSFSVLITLIPWFLQGITIPGRGIKALMCIGIAVAFGSVYFAISVCMRRDGKRLPEYMAHILLALGLMIVFQIFVKIYREYLNGTFATRTFYDIIGTIKLGWGTRNPVAAILGLCFPITFYFATKKHILSFLFLFLGMGEYIVILLLQSRGISMFSTIFLPVLLIFACVAAKRKIPVIISAISIVAAIAVTFVFGKEFIDILFNRLIDSGLNPNGRLTLYSAGLDEFLNNPIFGAGFDRDNGMKEQFFSHSNGPIYYHSTIIQILACFGLVGVAAYYYHYYWRYRVIFTNLDALRFAIFVGMAIFELYCFVDTVYFHPMGYFLMLCITLCAEKGLDYEQTEPNLFKLVGKCVEKRKKVKTV